MNTLPFSPAAERNQQPILEVLRQVLPARGAALEIASGTGQHAVWFTAGLPGWTWQPTDFDTSALPGHPPRCGRELLAPRAPADGPAFDDAPPRVFDAVYCANMLHIAPWATCGALMQGAARHLAPGGVLITYGPYLEDGVPTSPGNLDFDASLRARDPGWGLRRLADVAQAAQAAGLVLRERHGMPANNLLLVWAREPLAAARLHPATPPSRSTDTPYAQNPQRPV